MGPRDLTFKNAVNDSFNIHKQDYKASFSELGLDYQLPRTRKINKLTRFR
jgi:hypothetical protein